MEIGAAQALIAPRWSPANAPVVPGSFPSRTHPNERQPSSPIVGVDFVEGGDAAA
jgi:hypothetical protein